MNILDKEQNRLAAERYGCFSSRFGPPDKVFECKEIVDKLLCDIENTGSKRQREGAQLLRLTLTIGITLPEIAAMRGTTERDVRRLLGETLRKMREIAKTRYHFTSRDL